MMLIGITGRHSVRHSVQRYVKSRSVKVALKCLIAVVLVDVDLSYWTSKVEHLRPFSATVVQRMRRNGYL